MPRVSRTLSRGLSSRSHLVKNGTSSNMNIAAVYRQIQGSKDMFYRCRIIDMNRTFDKCKITSIDYGWCEWVEIDRLYCPLVEYVKTETQLFKFEFYVGSDTELRKVTFLF